MPKRSVAGPSFDPTIQFATLTIDGEDFKLAYDFNAISTAEHSAGCNLLQGLGSLTDLSAVQLRGLLYAALLVAHPDMTIHKAGRLIRFDTMPSVISVLGQAYSLSLPEKKSNADEKDASGS